MEFPNFDSEWVFNFFLYLRNAVSFCIRDEFFYF